jgi:single-strand DNA-binding protein
MPGFKTVGMTDNITLTGLVATEPKHLTTSEGLPITSFRLASTQRRYDRAKQSWVDGDTNWYTVTAFRRLASNAAMSITKGQRILVTGRLRLREWESGDRSGLAVEVEAEAIGHDLTWGTAQFSRNAVVVSVPDAAPAALQSNTEGAQTAESSGADWAASPVGEQEPALQGASTASSGDDATPF